MSAHDLLSFTRFLRAFERVQRRVYRVEDGRPENDAEHSFQLAMIGWYLIEKRGLSLDREAVLMYALAHDLVETYAGDVPAFEQQTTSQDKAKRDAEADALERIEREFPDQTDMHEVVCGYRERRDAESRFVYALDKLVPILNVYIDGGYSWRVNGLTLETIRNMKEGKIDMDPDVKELADELSALLEAEREQLFRLDD